jgi:hypothetical protein
MDFLLQSLDSELANLKGKNSIPPRTDSVQPSSAVPRKPTTIKRVNTAKLTAETVVAHTAKQQTISSIPKAPVDTQFRPNPPASVTEYQIKRKPLSPEAQAALIK